MATDSATTSTTTPPPSSLPRRRGLWQAPLFVLGVGALAAVLVCRPVCPVCRSMRIDRDLDAARHLLARPDGDADEALKRARQALEASEQVPERAAQAALTVADCHIRLAEKSIKTAAGEHWQRARQYLEQADHDAGSLTQEDRARLTYRLARVGFHTGDSPERIISRLQEVIDSGDDRAEVYDLLTRAYLKQDPPDLHKALEANQKLRDHASEAELSAAQLTAGELLLRLGKPEKARASLQMIRDQAQPAILLRARLLRARSYQDEKRWAEAATLYTNALADSRASMPQPAQVHYNLGLCYFHLDQPLEAAGEWQKCIRLARGPEGPAAAIRFADLRLRDPDPDKGQEAVDALIKAVEDVPTSERWTNSLVDLDLAREVFERAVSTFRQSGRHELALKVLAPFAHLGPRRRLLLLEGELATEWARTHQDRARERDEPLSEKEQKEVRDLFSRAAKAFGQATDEKGLEPKEQSDHLWASITSHRAAGENEAAAGKLRRLVELDVAPARLGEAWYLLGEEYRTAGAAAEAQNAYQMSMRYDTRFAYLARYRLAMIMLQDGNRDDAEAALALNVRQLRFASENEALSQSLFALGNLLYQRREYRRAARYLEDALVRVKDHPEAFQGRYRLADSYFQIALREDQEFLLGEKMSQETRAHFQKMHRQWMQKAADEFTTLGAMLESPAGREQLTKDLREQIPFMTARCWFYAGDYQKGLKIYEGLIERYEKEPKLLVDALGGAVTCHAALGQVTLVRQRLLQIEKVLPELPSGDKRKDWQEWLDQAKKGLPGEVSRDQ
jgi:tetratricopeptide (TPR) repeat protein